MKGLRLQWHTQYNTAYDCQLELLVSVPHALLALLSLGVAGSYLALSAMYYDDLGYLGDVPILYLTSAVIGVPLAAAAAGWLLAGREPPPIARAVIE
jgi:putative ABC transport system permease protein